MDKDHKSFSHPDWSYQANIYEVNVRQYTREGTFNAFSKHLPRLKNMGIKVLWFMPVTPISNNGRLGTLGSYYAASDYKSINPEFGTLEDFKNLVNEAHKLEFKIIIDFVANHTGNDHHWIKEHPEYYVYTEEGTLLHPHGWDDVSQLKFEEKKVWDELISAMAFWVETCDIDGFRCDMAHLVPLQLWCAARATLENIKPGLFWLAECEVPEYHQAFDATYTWRWMHASEDFVNGRMDMKSMLMTLFQTQIEFPCSGFRVYYTSNHDENSWNGTEFEKYNGAAKLMAVFTCTWNGLPMIYTGQELPNTKRLAFFERDPVEWNGTFEFHDFYKTLLNLKSNNPALRAADERAVTKIISSPHDQRVFAFLRKFDEQEVIVILNYSGQSLNFELLNLEGNYKNIFSGETISLSSHNAVFLDTWGYLVFEKIV